VHRTDVFGARGRRLREFRLDRIGQVIAWSLPQLEVVFAGRGQLLYESVRGIDGSPVLPVGAARPEISSDHDFGNDSNDVETLHAALFSLIEKSGRKLRQRRLAAQRLGIVLDYSDGMRQKVGIIQALQHDPELAILDEPTEGLDPLMQRAFYDILEERRAAGRTVFFSSHILSEVERLCDRVAIVRAGEVVALANVAELLNRRRRHVEIRMLDDSMPPALDGVAGVSDVVRRDGVLTCELEGDIGPFLAAIHGAAIADLTIEPARLEEVFLEYYADEGPAT